MQPLRLSIFPITLKEAHQYVRLNHRHHAPSVGGLFAVACGTLSDDGTRMGLMPIICGVAIVGRPVSRMMQDDFTAEVTRVATDGTKNACSMLYAATWRAARAMGYRRMITYTLDTEPGTSVIAAGWKRVAATKPESWSRTERPRVDLAPLQAKFRYEVHA